MLLLSDEKIDSLCEIPMTVAPESENPHITIQVSRTQSFCCWDELFSRLLLANSPMYLPPFFEFRKMVCVTLRTETDLKKDNLEIDKHHPIFGGGVFHPGYLIPRVKIKENQKPVFAFVNHQYKYTFPEAGPDMQFLLVNLSVVRLEYCILITISRRGYLFFYHLNGRNFFTKNICQSHFFS